MESARLSSKVMILRGAWFALVAFALAASCLLTPPAVFAAHNNPVVGEDGNLCINCHRTSSSSGATETGTNFIITNNRTLQNMKIALGNPIGPAPVNFGCTFCHNNDANTRMKGVLSHFTSIYPQASSHPIGETYNGWTSSRVDTKNEYLSNIDGNTGLSNELECTDCHLNTLLDDDGLGVGAYTYHVNSTNALRVANPYMLKSVTAAGQYDNFCRTCHTLTTGSNFQGNAGVNINVTSHGDASDAGANAIKEGDGTLIKTGAVAGAKCTYCHTGHFSGGKKLFKDTIDTSNVTKCVDCHENGDTNGNFENHGHGMNTSSKGNTINFNCGTCHGVNAAHDPSDSSINAGNPKMFNATEGAGLSKYGKSRTSICLNCHDEMQFTAHTGTTAAIVGCLDCHDEHAEGSGSGTNANRYMIPQLLPNNNATTESTFFQSNGDVEAGVWDYYVADTNARKQAAMGATASVGTCDNSICHAGKFTNTIPATPLTPLSTLMTSNNHTEGNRTAGMECIQCHTHADGGGSWAANDSCDFCHGQPPVSEATAAAGYAFSPNSTNESLTPHRRHVIDYGYSCAECHNKESTTPPHNEDPTKSYKSVWFNQTMNPATAAYPTTGDYVGTTYTCNNLYCHSDGQYHTTASQKDGEVWMTSASAPDWNAVGNDLSCEYCHGKEAVNAIGSLSYGAPDHINGGGQSANSHAKHPYACAVCHNSATQDTDPTGGWTIDLGGKKHVNGSIDLLAGSGYAFTFTTASHTCSGISCHGGNSATWGGPSLSCDGCHFRNTAGGGDQNNYALSDGTTSLINSEEWTTTGHGRTTAYPGSGNVAAGFVSTSPTDLKGCMYCHDGTVPHATAANPFRLRNKNALAKGLAADNAFGWNDNCLICHSTDALAVGVDPDGSAGPLYLPENSQAADKVNENHYGASHTGFPARGGTFCWDCHDPHGDTMQFMFHGTNGGLPGNGVTQTSDGAYGVPVTSRAVTLFDATAGGGTPTNFNSSDYVNAAFTGICQTCHTTAAYYNQSTNTPLASHNGADTMRCTTCHAHTADFTPSGCDSCHGNPPPPRPTAGTTQTWVSDNAALTQGDHTAHNGYGITDCNNTCHVITTHKQNKTSADMGVRAATAATSTGVHKYSTVDNVDVWTGNTAGITSVVDDSCVNVNCHNSTYSSNAWKSSANPTYVRYWNNSFDCYTCHAYDGLADSTIRPGVQTSVVADWIASGSHDQHVNRNGYAVACTNCHDTTGYTAARAGLHGNGSVNFVANFGAIRTGGVATGGVYDINGATSGWAQVTPFMPTTPAHAYYCGNVYCHSTGEPRGTLESVTYPATTQWTVPGSGACGTCHTVTASALITNVHEKHVGGVAASGTYSYSCQTCHNSVANGTTPPNAIVAGGYTLHVNGTNDVAFLAGETGAAYNRTTGGTTTPNGGVCTATYCHSAGLDWTAPYSVEASNVQATVADWDITQGTFGCGGCHGNPPAYTNGATVTPGGTARAKANSHAKHTYGCQICHNATTTTGTSISATGIPLHGNKIWNLAASAGQFTITTQGNMSADAYVATVCAAITCHGGNSATWGGPSLSCDGCHFRTTAGGGDQNNYALSDGTSSLINSEEWTTTGHGRTTAYPGSGNVAAGFVSTSPTDLKGCMYCHDGTVPHATAANPFRLRNNNALAQGLAADNAFGWNDNCLICHSTLPAATGVNPGAGYTLENAVKDVNENHYGASHTGFPARGGTFCWDCHDPHGDTMQFMFHGTNGGSPGAGVTQTSDGAYGVPVTSRAVTLFDATAGGGTPVNFNSSDYVNAAFTGICQTCHTTASWYNQSLNTPLASHNGADTLRCTSCHAHTADFAPSGCDTCHGNPPPPRPTAGTTQTWVSDNAALTQGDHTAHNGYGITDCNNTCHVITTHKQNKTSADMGVRTATAATSTGVHKYSTVDNVDVWTGNTAGITSVVDDSCVNVNCHNSTYSSNAWKSSANPTYVRYWNNSFDCYTCHAYDGLADSTIRPGVQTSVVADWIASGSHDQHVNRNGYAVACTNCHDTTGYTAARAGLHGNGSVNFVANFGGVRTGGVATGGVYDINGATGGWAQVAPFTPTTPAHAYYCGNVYCHSTGEPRGTTESISYATAAQWTVPGSGNCGTCHTTTASALITNVHEKHVGSAVDQYGYACQTCHYTVADATGTAIVAGGYALHVNGTNDVAFATNAGTYAYTGGTVGAAGGTCSNTYCHSKGLDFSAPYTGTNTTAPVVADWDIAPNGLGCFGCHGDGISIAYPTYTNDTSIMPGSVSFAKKNSHVKHNSFGCQVCHSGTTTTGNSITSKANHATGSWQISQPASGYTFTVAGGTLTDAAYTPVTCSAISCHGNGTAVWGATLACLDCHGVGAESAALGGASDSVANQITPAEWTNTGHGLAAGQYDLDAINGGGGNPAANKGCYTTDANGGCHVSTVTHVPAPADDPYRLGATYKADLNGLCLQASCHSTVSTNHHNDDVIANAATAYNFETKCVDCHDPHGDSNMFMVHSAVAVDGADVDTPAAMSAVTGVPDTTKPVTFVADMNGSDYSDTSNPYTGPFTGICEVCHTQTRWYQGTIANSKAGPQTGHTYITNCGSCHQHPVGFQGSGCDGCHGNGAGSNTPDSNPANTYEDRAGAHAKHVTAIGTGNSSCTSCHPGNPPATHPDGSIQPARLTNMDTNNNWGVDADAGNYLTLSGGNDADGIYNSTTQTCRNIDCHGGNETPAWYPDAVPPSYAPNNTITVTNTVSDGELQINWNPATDARTPPVLYDLYRQAGTVPDACATGAVLSNGANLGSTGFLDSGLTNGSAYSYCVKAKDSVTPTPNGANTTTGTATPTAPAAAGAVTYKFTKRNTGTIYGATAFNAGACSTSVASATDNPGAPSAIPYPFRGGLETANQCAANTNNRVTNGSPVNGAGTTFENMAAFYTPTTYASTTRVTGAATGSQLWSRSSTAGDDMRIYLASVNITTGVHTLSAAYSDILNNTTTLSAKVPAAFNSVVVDVPAGDRLAVLVGWADQNTTTSTNDNFIVDLATTTAAQSQVAVVESLVADVTAPTFAGIGTAVDAATGDAANLTWTAASDPSTPIRYTVYGYQSASQPTAVTLFVVGNVKASNLLATSTTVTGLATGNPWWFGVRATDTANNTDANTVISSPGVTITDATTSCTTCHNIPPTGAAAGKHPQHAPTGALTECDKCHGSAGYTVSNAVGGGYTVSGPSGLHNNGSNTVYLVRANAGQNDNGTYNPANGTCSNVDCHQNLLTPSWTGAQVDVTAPSWATPGVAVSIAGINNAANITWNAATDAGSPPVSYTVFWATSAINVFNGSHTGSIPGVTGLSQQVVGLTATPWFFGVRATDSATPVENTINSGTVSATPTNQTPSGGSKTYFLTKRNTGTIYQAVVFNAGACSTSTPSAANNPGAPDALPYPIRGGLDAANQCGASSANNRVTNSSPANGAGTTFENMAAFYTPAYATATRVTGAAAGSQLWTAGSAGTEDVRIWLASVNTTTGVHTRSAASSDITNNTTTLSAKLPAAFNNLTVDVPAGDRLAVMVTWADTSTTASTSDRFNVDLVTGQQSQVAVIEMGFPPVWTGGISGINVANSTGAEALDVSWNSATTSLNPPVSYKLYRKTGTDDPFNTPDAGWPKTYTGTTMRDAGLTLGTTYYYGVRAQDNTMPTPNATTNTDTASGTASSGSCGICHGYPPTTGVNHGLNLTAPLTTAGFSDAHGDCLYCHGKSETQSLPGYTGHADGSIAMNSDLGYSGTGNCTVACHSSDANHTMGVSGTMNHLNIAMGKSNKAMSWTCSNCHASGQFTAPVVGSGAHADPDGSGSAWAPGDCMGCHAGHIGAPGVVVIAQPSTTWDPDGTGTLVANASLPAALGVTTSTHGAGAIALGGNGTVSSISALTTEAQICWGCHDAVAPVVSEWGVNTDSNGAAPNLYNFGTVTTSNWTTATWTSAQTTGPSFGFKSAAIQSTHAANPGVGVQGLDATVGNIRCSYCHDVHDTKGPAGKPYLRGTWMGNPYKEDGPPMTASTYVDLVPWGLVPRMNTSATNGMGGYWIDQNSGNPAGTWNAAGSAGLCELCHANGDGTFTSAEIDALNTFDANGVGWVSALNGHRNAVLGGTLNDTVAARNIFGARGGALNQDAANTADHPFQIYDGTSVPGDASGGFRAPDSNWMYTPAMTDTQPMDTPTWTATVWGTAATPNRALDLRGTVVNAGYHQFPCSKCHNPHASRLPRLMITNCLDTKHNQWDNGFQLATTTDAVNLNRAISNWSSANNCHRLPGVNNNAASPSYDSRADAAATSGAGNQGWNTVTPWTP